jgi:hypothetical protein
LIPFSTAAVVPMTPIRYSGAKLKHQILSRNNPQKGTERSRREERIADSGVDSLPPCKRLLGR